MGNFYKRGKVWYIDISVNGRRIRKRVGSSKRIAELTLKDAEVKAARQEFSFANNDITLEKFFEKFHDYSRANHRESTTKRYSAVIDHFNGFLKGHSNITFVSEVTTELIDQYKVYRKDSLVNPNGHHIESDEEKTKHLLGDAYPSPKTLIEAYFNTLYILPEKK